MLFIGGDLNAPDVDNFLLRKKRKAARASDEYTDNYNNNCNIFHVVECDGVKDRHKRHLGRYRSSTIDLHN